MAETWQQKEDRFFSDYERGVQIIVSELTKTEKRGATPARQRARTVKANINEAAARYARDPSPSNADALRLAMGMGIEVVPKTSPAAKIQVTSGMSAREKSAFQSLVRLYAQQRLNPQSKSIQAQVQKQQAIFDSERSQARVSADPFARGAGPSLITDRSGGGPGLGLRETEAAALTPTFDPSKPVSAQNPLPANFGEFVAGIKAFDPSKPVSADNPLPANFGSFIAGLQGSAPGGEAGGGTAGGGGGSAVSAGGMPASTAAPAAGSEDETRNFLYANYGAFAYYFDDPDIGPILREAAQARWPKERLQARLTGTDWWKRTQQASRLWDAEARTDPATVQAKLEAKALEIRILASRMGLEMDGPTISDLANSSLRLGWNEQQIGQALFAQGRYTGADGGGDMGATINQYRALAGEYFLNLDDGALRIWAQKKMTGESDDAGFTAYVQQLSEGQFPTMAKEIRAGITPAAYFEPYRAEMSRLLEKPITTTDLRTNPKFSAILQTTDKDGSRRPMTISEAQTYTRGLEEYRYTRQAQELGAGGAEMVNKLFGAVA